VVRRRSARPALPPADTFGGHRRPWIPCRRDVVFLPVPRPAPRHTVTLEIP
jgi:hypothetical protein